MILHLLPMLILFHSEEIVGQTTNDITSITMTRETTDTPTSQVTQVTTENSTSDTEGRGFGGLPGSSATCNYVLYDGEGNFTTFDYPAPYDNDMDCTYRVRRTDTSCHLEVTFHEFDLEGNINDLCLKDYLIINGKKYCGNSWKGKTELIPFRPDLAEISFLFHSDGDVSGKGFWIEVKRLPGTCSLSSQDSCNKDFISKEFNLLSPNFPGDYSDNQECFFLVIKHSEEVCRLEMTFQAFDIEPSDNCSYDYLEINSKKLCGTISSGEVRSFMFPDEEMMIHFNSDEQNTRSGFSIVVKQIDDCYQGSPEASTISATLSVPPACNIVTNAESGEIISPGYPAEYPANITCMYTVLKRDEGYCNVEMDFVDFDLEYTIGCMGDFLQVDGKMYCGTSLRGLKKNLSFDSDSAALLFQTDLTSGRPGLKIKFLQLPCPPSSALVATAPPMLCGNIFEQQEFYLQSPNYPSNYSNSMDCQYVIRRKDSKICALEIMFNYFKIETSSGCRKDYLEIDGEKYCDQLPENVIRTFPFLTADKVISFHSDSTVSAPGFFIHVIQQECDPRSAATANEECSQEIREAEFELKSPNYPRNYDNDLSCQYTVHRTSQSVCELALNIQDFKLQEGEVCENDYLQIGEERLCGSISSGTIRTYSFGSQDKIFLNFESDSSKSEKGFSLIGKQRNCDATDQPPWITTTLWPMKPLWASTQAPNCDQIITMTQYVLRSPEYPSNYPDNLDCQYQINRVTTMYCELEITISDLHIQVGDSCQFDYLEVDGHRFCGSTTAGNKRIFTFKTERILINFHSDFSVSDRGFEVTLKQRECTVPSTTTSKPPPSKSCDDVFDSAEFILMSPNFPNDYDNNLNCKFIIRRSEDNICKLEMLFLAFDVESSSECEYDYLLINGEKICGMMENITRTYLFQDYEKVLTFHSDSGTSRPGFMIQVRQVECFTQTTEPPLPLKPCNKEFAAPTFEIRSDNYPSHYDPNLNCIYTIIPTSRDICSLDVTFISFDIEASDGCQYDYLEIDGEKLCGVYPANLKRNIKVVSREVTFKFHSDGATSRPGFNLRVQQIDCSEIVPPKPSVTPPISCDQKLSDRSGTFQSPKFPYNYPKNVLCTYVFIGKPDYCRVLLKFLEFSLQAESSVCEQDYLEVNGIKYCGPQLLEQTRTLTFYGSPREINITFRTDADIEDKGFYATYRQLPCATPSPPARTPRPSKTPPVGTYVPSCDRLYASLKFKIISPDYPKNYPDEKECRYTIRRVSGKICKLRLTFVLFDVESSEGCEYDYLEIENDKLCGTLPENSVREYEIQDYQIIMKFHSDGGNTRSGFVIKAEQVECATKQQTQQPSLFPPPRDVYPPVITVEHPLEEEHFAYPPPSPPLVTLEDYDHLFDHPHHPHLPHKLPAASSNRYDYRNCDRIFQKEEFEIRSVNFPSNYPNSLNCRYIVRKANIDICWVKLTFIRFDVETSEDCQYDYLSINSKRICGTLPDDEVQAYIFSSDELSLYFRSDGATAKRGFMIRGEQLPCNKPSTTARPSVPSVCDRMYEKDLFVIQSPNFPDDYPNSIDCHFTIKKANRYICGLELTLLSFDIENDIDCGKDYLLIEGEKLCGPMPSKITRRLFFSESEKNITFHTDGKYSKPGFSILVKQVEDCDNDPRSVTSSKENCDQAISSEKFVLQSTFFPEDYPPNITCHYTINRFSSSVCSLELTMLSFELEEEMEGSCNDYLEIEPERKLCGHLPKGHSERVPFIGGSLELTFTSNFKIQKPGFSLLGHQVTECAAVKVPGVKGAVPKPPHKDSSTCDETYSAKEFSIRTPNFPNDYPHDVTCKYTILPSSGEVCALELWFAHFDVEDGPECSYDYFDIGYKTVCGQLPSGFSRVIPFDTPSKLFVFHSDKGTSKTGFAIKIKQVTDCTSPRKPEKPATTPQPECEQYLKENRGHLTSPSYPDDYRSNLRCIYHIVKSRGFCGLEIYFHDFHLEHSPDCSKDFLAIGDKQYCGLELKRKAKKLRFPAGDRSEIVLKFHTNENGGATGFHMEYRQLPCRRHSGRPGSNQQEDKTPISWSQSNGSFISQTELSLARSDLHPVQLPLTQNAPSFPSYRYYSFHNTSGKK